MRKLNYTHVIVALVLGAVLMHCYRTKTAHGQATGK